ncbi:MAG: hypothetical protein M3O50_00770 [Myxococcota bacterium]|nr:hypothetical protein [Myxococcota bacterium]
MALSEVPDPTPAKRGIDPNAPARAPRLTPDTAARRLVIAAAIYLVSTSVFATLAGSTRLLEHTPFNHYALLADAWLHGRQDLAGGPPAYAMNNDFAEYKGKTYISFPPFPAALMVPFVKLSGSAENFRDGQFVVWLAGFAPAFLFLALEKLRRTARSERSEAEDIALSLLFAFGTVYFFTAVEGTVWFAALVVASALSALFVLCSLDAEKPLVAGAMIGLLWLTRPHAVLMSVLFGIEALRVSVRPRLASIANSKPRTLDLIHDALSRVDGWLLMRRCALFAGPIVCALAIVTWMNWTRYGRATPVYFDHEFLNVGWHARIVRWGMFHYHYLAKNLGIMLTSLPWLPAKGEAALGAPFKINEHGLALWFTTPLYFWLLWPKAIEGRRQRKWFYVAVAVSAALPAMMDLLYQNSGWRQFGYRFSNDYAVLLFVLLAVGVRKMRSVAFVAASIWAVACNLFGAATFDKAEFTRFYYSDGSQNVVYQPD